MIFIQPSACRRARYFRPPDRGRAVWPARSSRGTGGVRIQGFSNQAGAIMKTIVLALFVFLGFRAAAFSGIEIIEKEISTEAADKALAARRAVGEVSWDLARAALGEQKLQKNKRKIKKRIIDNKNRYVLSTKAAAPELQEDGSFLTRVTMGVSRKNLQALLVEHNLFYSSQGVSCLLPVVSFEASLETKESYLWWREPWEKPAPAPKDSAPAAASGAAPAAALAGAGKPALPRRMAAFFFEALGRRLLDEGFYALDPVFSRSYEHLPESAIPKGSLLKHFEPLARLLRCDIIISGSVRVNRDGNRFLSFLYFKIFNIKTRQILFQIRKRFALASLSKEAAEREIYSLLKENIFKNFAYQLALDKEKGSLDLSRMLLNVQGPLNYYQKEKLKAALIKYIPAIKDLQERFLASNRIIYEMESAEDMAVIAKSLKSLPVPFFAIQVTGYSKRQASIYVKELAPPAPPLPSKTDKKANKGAGKRTK